MRSAKRAIRCREAAMRSRFAILAVALIGNAISAHSQTLDEQERCAAQARRAFQEVENQFKTQPLTQTISSDYESHYNTKIKKCLMLMERIDTLASGKGNITTTATLMDAYERHVYANYIWISSPTKKYWEVPPAACELFPVRQEKKICADRDEFDSFVSEYMEK